MDLNIEVAAGELVARVGPVGCGKSSLLAAAWGECDVLRGTLRVAAGGAAMVPQKAFLIAGTISDNVLLGRPLIDAQLDAAIDACALRADIDALPHGLATEVGERGVTLSGGQQQRLALARALYGQPALLLLDDPLSAVDARTGAHILKSLRAVCQRRRRRRGAGRARERDAAPPPAVLRPGCLPRRWGTHCEDGTRRRRRRRRCHRACVGGGAPPAVAAAAVGRASEGSEGEGAKKGGGGDDDDDGRAVAVAAVAARARGGGARGGGALVSAEGKRDGGFTADVPAVPVCDGLRLHRAVPAPPHRHLRDLPLRGRVALDVDRRLGATPTPTPTPTPADGRSGITTTATAALQAHSARARRGAAGGAGRSRRRGDGRRVPRGGGGAPDCSPLRSASR